MKKIINILFVILVAVGFSACDPQEDKSYTLGDLPNDSQVSFTATPSASKANLIELKNTSQVPGIVTWSFGNGGTGKGESVSAPYPLEGDYTVVMTLYTKAGPVSKSGVVKITGNDFSLLDTPGFNALTGGASKPEGKTWVFDQYHSAHFGVYPNDHAWSWNAGPNVKEGSSLYTQEFTFIQDGLKMKWKNNGYIYTNKKGVDDLAKKGYPNAKPTPVDDYDVEYMPKSEYTFSMSEAGMTITLHDGAFFGHYAGASTYKITKLTEDVLEINCASTVEDGNNWLYRFIPKEKNIKPVVDLRAVALKETFENQKSSVVFKKEDMGTSFSQWYQNPAPIGLNTSPRVCLYQKTNAFYSNLSWTAMGYKFDLSAQNKIRIKVFIPSFNDYTTENAVDGPWVTNKKLLPQVAVKLQNSESSAPWETQKEIVKANLTLNQWLDLEFDFSEVKDRKDYDKIVIQFGAEGHAGPGIFYFDDFTFSK